MTARKDTIIATYDFDDDKKDSITRAMIDKMIRQIRDELRKNQNLKVVISK